MRRLLLAAALFLFWAGQTGQAMLAPITFAATAGSISITGPCDLVTCAEAYSVTRALKNSYTGNLFQLGRTSDSATLEVGQTSARIANLAGVASHCALTTCVISRIYGQINSNTLEYVNSSMSGYPNPRCAATYGCAALFLIDPANGLPIVRTTYPAGYALINDGTATGITGGTSAISIFKYGRDEGWTECCGTFGLSHTFATANTVGSFFGQWNRYGQVDNSFFQCSTTTALCSGISEESADRDGADYSPTANQDIMGLITWDGAAATNTVKVYVNSATAIFSGSPPCSEKNSGTCSYGVHPINLPTAIHFGMGGDTSHVDTIFREGLFVNGTLSGSDFTSLSSNLTTFYSGRSAPTCSGTADISFGWPPDAPTNSFTIGQYGAFAAYGLYQMRPDYYGPIAELQRTSDNATSTFAPDSSGCGLGNNSGGTSAATWCNATTCKVKTLYNQGMWSTVGNGSSHDTALDLVQATTSKQPVVTFSGLNSHPVMTFAGGQLVCSAATGTWTRVSVLALVGRRTGNTSNYQQGLTQYIASNTLLGWNNAANQAETYSPLITGAANDNTYHSFIAEANDITNTTTLYVNNSSVGTGAGSFWGGASTKGLCIGGAQDGVTQLMTGDIAEASVHQNFAPGSAANDKYGYSAQHSAIFAAHQATWGSLPH